MTRVINIIGYGQKPADEFQPNPDNAKVHPAIQDSVVSYLLDTLGWIKPVIENRRNGYLIDGHERVADELKKNPPGIVPYCLVDLDPEQEALALAVLDASSRLAIYDRANVLALKEYMRDGDPAVAELMRRIEADAVDFKPLTEQPEPPPIVKSGDVWRVGVNRVYAVYMADIPNRLASGVQLDGVILDPTAAAYIIQKAAGLGLAVHKES